MRHSWKHNNTIVYDYFSTLKVTEWCDGDTEENCIKKGYARNITYEYNTNGFRSDEFDDSEHFLFLGCSNTKGVAVKKYNIWNYLFTDWYNTQYGTNYKWFNAGFSGGNIEKCCMMAQQLICKNTKGVFCLFPSMQRDSFYTVDPHYPKEWKSYRCYLYLPNFPYAMPEFENYAVLNSFKNMRRFIYGYKFIKQICDYYNVPLYWSVIDGFKNNTISEVNEEDHRYYFKYSHEDNGRDNIHPGNISHYKMFEALRRAYENNQKVNF